MGGGAGAARTLLSAWLLSACEAAHSCGQVQCADGQQCCPVTSPLPGNGSAAVRCCRQPLHAFFDSLGWVTRKLSGILILLLLFAVGYFIQRLVCPRPRRQHNHEHASEPSLLNGHACASQDSLLERYPEYSAGGFSSPSLPAYDEVKYLPTYEESMRETRRDHSDHSLLTRSTESGEQGRDLPGVAGPRHNPRTTRNSV